MEMIYIICVALFSTFLVALIDKYVKTEAMSNLLKLIVLIGIMLYGLFVVAEV